MAIDESFGIRERRDKVVTSHAFARGLALILRHGPVLGRSVGIRTWDALVRRGWIEQKIHPELGPYVRCYHLTESGRVVAEASPAVREWIEGWESGTGWSNRERSIAAPPPTATDDHDPILRRLPFTAEELAEAGRRADGITLAPLED